MGIERTFKISVTPEEMATIFTEWSADMQAQFIKYARGVTCKWDTPFYRRLCSYRFDKTVVCKYSEELEAKMKIVKVTMFRFAAWVCPECGCAQNTRGDPTIKKRVSCKQCGGEFIPITDE